MSEERARRRADPSSTSSDFVGREPELDTVVAKLLHSVPLLTMVGPGGIGKTRLAAEAMRRYQHSRRTPAHWVRLGRLARDSDPTAIAEEVAKAVIDIDFSGRSVWAALLDTFTHGADSAQGVRTVLVLDNCEHLLTGVGEFISRMLETVPGLTIVATSREAIGWVDEQLLPVPPLTARQAQDLFQRRADLTGHPVTGAEAIATVDRVCRHLHNNPLYIRLAAARLLRQPLPAILRELSGESGDDRRLRWAHGPRTGADERHRAVRDVIAWSYDLCSPAEQLLFDRLSVFAAGYEANPEDVSGTASSDVGADLEAITAVCADDGEAGSAVLPAQNVEELLERLVDRSLVTMHISATTVRFSLLESLRIFAQQRLSERSEGPVNELGRTTARHRRYYRDKVIYAGLHWFSPAEQDLLNWARAAWNNILTAIETSVAIPGEPILGLEICIGLLALRLPFFKGSFREMRFWTERTLAATRSDGPAPVDLQVTALAMLVWIVSCQGRTEDAERMLDECVALALPVSGASGDWRNAQGTDLGLPAPVEFAWGALLLVARGDATALPVLSRAREKFDCSDNSGWAAMSELFAVLAAGLIGPAGSGRARAEANVRMADASGGPWVTSWARLALAITLIKDGDPTAALAVGREALTHQYATRDQWGGLWAVEFRTWALARLILDRQAAGAAASAELQALAVEIAQLAGGAQAWRGYLGVEISRLRPFAAESERAIAVAREVLGPQRYLVAEAQGAQLDPRRGAVQRLALGAITLEPTIARKPAATGWADLSEAEQQVALLGAAGWTNAAIAARRGNSLRTVDAQMSMVLQKLTIRRRGDIIRFVPADRMGHVRAAAARRPERPREF